MDEKIPYIVFEGEQARHERTVKRLVLALLMSTTRAQGRKYRGS